jgi:hypothetical protein
MPPTAPLIPQILWFRYAFACPRVENLPRSGKTSGLLDLPESCRLPALVRLEDRPSWADMRAAWNPDGLAIDVRVRGRKSPLAAAQPTAGLLDGIQVWVDTRDTRDIHRATRYAQRFQARLLPGKGSLYQVELTQKPIPRALADAPTAPASALQARAERLPDGWRIELFLGAAALHGFDPEINRRLGLMLHAADSELGDEFLGVGREFPIEGDPSLWHTLELRDHPASS